MGREERLREVARKATGDDSIVGAAGGTAVQGAGNPHGFWSQKPEEAHAITSFERSRPEVEVMIVAAGFAGQPPEAR